jgi:hypothetical protein
MDLKRFFVEKALKYIKPKAEEYFNAAKWDNDDAENMKSFLASDTGKKFANLLVFNSNRCAASALKDGKDLAEVKAESKAWLALLTMIRMLCVQKKTLEDHKQMQKLNQEKLDEIFASIISNNSRVTGAAIYGR